MVVLRATTLELVSPLALSLEDEKEILQVATTLEVISLIPDAPSLEGILATTVEVISLVAVPDTLNSKSEEIKIK